MNIRPKKPIFTISVNLGFVIFLFVPLGSLYNFYRLPIISLTIICCVLVYMLIRAERYNFIFWILPLFVTLFLGLEIFDQYRMFGMRSGYMYW